MNIGVTDRLRPLLDAVRKFIDERVLPVEEEFLAEIGNGDRWSLNERQIEILEGLKSEARKQGLWNLWLTDSNQGYGLAARPTPETWKCSNATVPKSKRDGGLSRC
jgi:acyl-CoA dehydrogenase